MKGIPIMGISEGDKRTLHLAYVERQLRRLNTFQMKIVHWRGGMNENIIVLRSIDFKGDDFKLQKAEAEKDKFITNSFHHPHFFSRGKKLKENKVIPQCIKYQNIRRTLPIKNV